MPLVPTFTKIKIHIKTTKNPRLLRQKMEFLYFEWKK